MDKLQNMKRTYRYYSNSKRAWAHVDAKNKNEVLKFAKSVGDDIKSNNINLLKIDNKYV